MKWDDLVEENPVIPDIGEYEEKLKQYSIENIKFYEGYYAKQEAFKMKMYKDFESSLPNGFIIEKNDLKNISAKNSKITIILWEEQEQDNHLILNFRQPDGYYWGFALYIEPNEKSFEKLTDNLGWYINTDGKLVSFRDNVKTIDFYKKEVEKAQKLISMKREIFKNIDKLDFGISLWRDDKIGNFKTLKEALDKAVELS